MLARLLGDGFKGMRFPDNNRLAGFPHCGLEMNMEFMSPITKS